MSTAFALGVVIRQVFACTKSFASEGTSVANCALNDPVDTAATTGTGVTESEIPSGAARVVAFSLGALAGRKALLLPWVTLDSEGSCEEIAPAATIQNTTMAQRNFTEKWPIPRKMSSTCTRQR